MWGRCWLIRCFLEKAWHGSFSDARIEADELSAFDGYSTNGWLAGAEYSL
jgi:hypothetical protein